MLQRHLRGSSRKYRSNGGDDEQIPAFCTRIFHPRLPKSVAGSYGETDLMRLIPGGRYLVTANGSARISVWDLGYSPVAIINPYPLTSVVLPFLASHLLIEPTKNQEGFRIVTLYPIANNLVDVLVYEIYPAAANPSFKQVAHRRINSVEIQAVALHLDRFAYYCDFLLTIWDFVEDTSATVHLYQPLTNITVSPTTVIGRHENGIIVVDIPPLHPRGTPAADAVVEPITPPPNDQPRPRRLWGSIRATHHPGRLAHLPPTPPSSSTSLGS
ncbi:hypothetical protein MSAN_01562700 [Mycena sanguinolenta]|uniref:Uncharacterized protein n=1 Tax=Mycena sanguinolenta TaxID=230812 RepID=A0A8H7CX15_9AGAR|nr:hypothetical protein MSAN_01562700 [Mycena sanguinolenta]